MGLPCRLTTTANAHDTQPVGALLDRATQDGWSVKRVRVDGIHVGGRMAQAGAVEPHHGSHSILDNPGGSLPEGELAIRDLGHAGQRRERQNVGVPVRC